MDRDPMECFHPNLFSYSWLSSVSSVSSVVQYFVFILAPNISILDFQPFLADSLVRTQTVRRAFEYDFAMTHDVEALRNFHCNGQFLLDQQDRHAAVLDFLEQIGDLLDNLG